MKAFPWQCSRDDMCIVLVIYHFFTHFSEVVFIKMPSRQQQRRAKRRAEYLQNRNEELDTSLGFGASKRGRECCDEQNSDDIRASKKQKTNRDSKRSHRRPEGGGPGGLGPPPPPPFPPTPNP